MRILFLILISINCFGQSTYPFYDSLKITRLHNRNIKGDTIKIAVIDTGSRPDTAIQNITSVDFTNTTVYDSSSHGYLLINAGAARYTGIAPNCHVYSLKIYNTNANPHCTFDTIIHALDYCLNNGIQIVTFAISVGTYAQLNAKITQLYNAGIIVFVSAGNNPGISMIGAAQCDSAIGVGARDETLGFISSYLTSHNKIQISGTNGICCVGGSSQSSSTMAFLTCLIRQRFPEFSPLQIKVALQQVAQPWIAPYNPTYTSSEGITLSALIGRYLNTFIY